MKYWSIVIRLQGGWNITTRLLADNFGDAIDAARQSLETSGIYVLESTDRLCVECTEIDSTTGGPLPS